MTPSKPNRRASDDVVLPIYLTDERSTVELADGEVVGVGFTPFLDEARTVEIKEDDRSPVLPGVVYSPGGWGIVPRRCHPAAPLHLRPRGRDPARAGQSS